MLEDPWKLAVKLDYGEWDSATLFWSALKKTKNLTRLHISESCDQEALGEALAANTSLKSLRFSYFEEFNLCEPLPAVPSLLHLELLQLECFSMSSLISVVSMAPNLQSLVLGVAIEDYYELDALWNLKSLTHLDIRVSSLYSGALEELTPKDDSSIVWPHLRSLKLSGVSDDDVGFITYFASRLNALNLAQITISEPLQGNIFESLLDIHSLEFVSFITLTDASFAGISENSKKSLHSLTLEGCLLLSSPSTNKTLSTLPNLKYLSISGSPDLVLDGELLKLNQGVANSHNAM